MDHYTVRFEPNNNTVLGGKYLDMGNGLQTLLTRNQLILTIMKVTVLVKSCRNNRLMFLLLRH